MQIETSYVDVTVAGKVMRTFVAAPADDKRYPGILFYSDIFQLSESTLRWVKRLASYGFVVAAPEIYYRIEPAGTVLEFDDAKARSADRLTLTPSMPSSSTKTSSAGSPGCGTTHAFRLRRWESPGTARAATSHFERRCSPKWPQPLVGTRRDFTTESWVPTPMPEASPAVARSAANC